MSFLSEAQKKELLEIRAVMDLYVSEIAGIPAKINSAVKVIRPWKAGTAEAPVTYTANVDVRMYDRVPYTCSQTHTHRGEPGWEPGPESALWKETHGTTPVTARPFVTRGDNPYMEGEYCTENEAVYRCKQDNITWAPSQYPQAWEVENT